VLIGVAVALPLLMAVVLLYRVRDGLRRGQFSLRTLLAINLVIAFYLALWPLFVKPSEPVPTNRGPSPLAHSARFEVYQVAVTEAPTDKTFTEPGLGEKLRVSTPPLLTAADVWQVELVRPSTDRPHASLMIALNAPGANKLLTATAVKRSRLVVVVDGEVLAAPRVPSPLSTPLELVGGDIGDELFDTLVTEKMEAEENGKAEAPSSIR
jgi:hypothetical protein